MRFGQWRDGEIHTVDADTLIATQAQVRALANAKPGVYTLGKTHVVVMADPEDVRTEHVAVETR